MNVVVFGCGPAGLFAAEAAKQSGCDVIIYSKKNKSTMYGAQYLHRPIPGTESYLHEGVSIKYLLNGTPESYRKKVYGDMWDGTVSPEDLEEDHLAWDIREAYHELWDRWSNRIIDLPYGIERSTVRVLHDGSHYGTIINSIPRPQLCFQRHPFGSTQIWAAGEAPEIGIKLPYNCPPQSVLCDGGEDVSWYRLSNIFGRKTIEWSGERKKPPISGVAKVTKPTSHGCDCWPKITHVGRYGRWEKGVLSHSAYFDTLEKLGSL